ncbi:beta-lactamase [Halomonas urumqiensis]|nr:beta-lactamase [Halomonas urumqiensis]
MTLKLLMAGALALVPALSLAPLTAVADAWQSRDDWAALFQEHDAEGALLVVDERQDSRATWVHNAARAEQRFVPASTFKVPHTLFVLDAGVAEDEFQVFAWDGIDRGVPAWNADQNLRSAMRNSTVWLYQRFARELGEESERRYLEAIGFGNAEIGADLENFWLEPGHLEISAEEQIDFLQRLHRNELPFDEADQRLVKDLMIVETGRDWMLRAKTGWSGELGWWVGWVEWPSGPVFFALNMDTPNRMDDIPKRDAIVRAALRDMEALP